MAIKKKSGGGGGANWMDTYGDMVTLLLCFFVLLYSMSTVSEDKWKAIVQSFNPAGIIAQLEELQGGSGPSADENQGGGVFDNPNATDEKDAQQQEIEDLLHEMAQQIQQMAVDEGLEDAITVEEIGGKIYLEFSDTVFFGGDSYAIRSQGQQVLLKLCGVLDQGKKAIFEIRVQGHTAQADPNKPNGVTGDRRLASNRATEVVIFLMEHSTIHPARIISEGYGQWRPIGDNKTEAGRAPNRRVEMIISGVDLEDTALNEAMSKFISLDGGES